MEARIRLVLFDLDGTLLGEDGRVSSRNAAAIKRLRESGVHVGVATGRAPTAAREALQVFAENGGCSVAVYQSGAVVLGPDGAVWSSRALPATVLAPGCRVAEARGLPVMAYTDDSRILCASCSSPRTAELRAKFGWGDNLIEVGAPLSQNSLLAADSAIRVNKLSIKLLDEEESNYVPLQEEVRAIAATQPGQAAMLTNDRNAVDLSPGDCDKVEALPLVLERLGITVDEVVAFGDGANDMRLMQAAKLGIAMANAPEAVRKIADVVIGAHGTDAIADFLNAMPVDGGAAVYRFVAGLDYKLSA